MRRENGNVSLHMRTYRIVPFDIGYVFFSVLVITALCTSVAGRCVAGLTRTFYCVIFLGENKKVG